MEHVFYVNDNIGYVTVPVPENIYGNAKYQPDFMDVKIKGKNSFYYGSEVIADELKVKINGNGNTLLIGSYTKLAGAIHIIGDNLTVLSVPEQHFRVLRFSVAETIKVFILEGIVCFQVA